jgi:hypothetical protein
MSLPPSLAEAQSSVYHLLLFVIRIGIIFFSIKKIAVKIYFFTASNKDD